MADLENQFKVAELMSKPTSEGGMSYGDYPNPYGLRAFDTAQGYGGEMMPKTAGWAGEIPTLTGDKMTEMSLGGEKGQPFIPMIFEGITPEQIEIVKDYEAGLREDSDPLVIEVKKAAEAAAHRRMHMHKSPFKDLTPHMAGGGALAEALGKKLAEAAAKKTAERAAKNYVPTKSMISELKDYIKDAKGSYGAQRVERAADLVPNLEKQYDLKSLKDAFDGDNAKSLMVIHPGDFEKYAKPLPDYYDKPTDAIKFENGKQVPTIIQPEHQYSIKTGLDKYGSPTWDSKKMHPEEYLDLLGGIARDKGFDWLPYLMLGEESGGTFRIAGHEGRHRNRALNKLGDETTLINLLPQNIREGLPRRSQEEYQKGLQELLGDKPKVRPEDTYEKETRPDIYLPDFFKEGGPVHMAKGGDTIEEWKPEPISSKFADTLSKTRSALDEAFPVDIGSFLLQQSPEIIKDMSYGKSPVSGTKNIQTTTFDPRLVDLQMAAAPFAGSAKKLLKNVGTHALEKIEAGTFPGLIESRMYAADPGKRAAKYTKKEAIQSDLRHMPYEDALPFAQKGVHLKQDTNGQFIGAPRGVTSLRDIKKIRENYDKMVEEGAKGGDWYERAQQFHKEYTHSPEAATELSRANALFSAQADPISNLGFTLQAHNALEAGAKQPIVRTGPAARRYYNAIEQGKPIPLGQKTDIYAKYIDPNLGIGSTGVNDFRHARNLGYTQKDLKTGEVVPISRGLSPQEHAFMDAETILATDRANKKALLGKTDWKPEEVQAAPWVLQKAESLMKGSPGRFPTLDKAMEEANKTYLEGAPKHTAYSTYEQIPFASSGHLEGMEKVPYNLKEQFSKEANWFDQFGKDILSQQVGKRHGMLTGETKQGYGAYVNPVTKELELNPQSQARSLVALKPGKEGVELQPQSKALMDVQNALRGYLDVQGASPWIKPLPGKVTPSTSLHLKLTEPLNQQEMSVLNNVASSHGFNGVVDLGDHGVILGFNDAIKSGQDLKKLLGSGLEEKLNSIFPEKLTEIKRIRTEGGYPSFEDVLGKEHEGTGAATKRLLQYLEEGKESAPDVAARLMDSNPVLAEHLRKLNARDIAAQQKYGVGAPRKDILNARDIISKSGLSGLKKSLEEGAYLPAALAVPFASENKNEE